MGCKEYNRHLLNSIGLKEDLDYKFIDTPTYFQYYIKNGKMYTKSSKIDIYEFPNESLFFNSIKNINLPINVLANYKLGFKNKYHFSYVNFDMIHDIKQRRYLTIKKNRK